MIDRNNTNGRFVKGLVPFNFVDFTGKELGDLNILYRLPNVPNRHESKWMCFCKRCNTTAPIRAANLRGGKSRPPQTMCGKCSRKNGNRKNHKPYGPAYNSMKRIDSHKGYECMSYDEFIVKISNPESCDCHYCGGKIIRSQHGSA